MADNKLSYIFTGDESDLLKKIDKMEERLKKFSKSADEKLKVKTSLDSKAANKGVNIVKNSVEDLKQQLKVLEDQKIKLNITTPEFDKKSKEVFALKQKINAANKKEENAAKARAVAERERERERKKAARDAVNAMRKIESKQKAIARGSNSISNSYRKQSLYLQNLNTLAASYLSVFAVGTLVNRIREVTGEFELQNKALGAILQNKEKADELFVQVTDLASKSPFSIRELISYTKQLAAYRIESDQLMGTLTRLADVSAGLGVDMSRLILAYGQVRAASVLRGQELRQFTEAGIPLVGLLAEKFTELEGRVVSTNEVFDKISKRMVSFSMVSEIFEDMTKKGGIFFEAQAVQAKTLAGQWSILGDELDKAYNKIGKENVGLLKGGVEVAIDLAKNLDKVLDVVKGLIVVYGVWKVAIVLNNSLRAKQIVLAKYQVKSMREITAASRAQVKEEIRMMTISGKLQKSWKSLTTTLRTNIYAIAITAIGALGYALYESYQESQKLNRELKELVGADFTKFRQLADNFEDLATAAINATDGSQRQREILAELNRTYKNYLPNQVATIENLREMKGNYDQVTEAIERKIRVQTIEKAEQKINEKFIKESSAALNKMVEGLSAQKGVTKEAAVAIAKRFREELKLNLEQGGTGEEINLQNIFKDFMDFGLDLDTKATAEALRGAKDYKDILIDTNEAREKTSELIEVISSKSNTRTIEELNNVTKIKNEYEKLNIELRKQKTTPEVFKSETLELQKSELKDLIQLYQNYADNAEDSEDKIYNLKRVEEYRAKLMKITGILGIYEEAVTGVIKKSREANEIDINVGKMLGVGEAEDLAAHQKKVLDIYNQTTATIKQLTNAIKEYEKQGINDKRLDTEKDALRIQKDQLKIAEDIIKAFNIQKKGDGSAISSLKTQLKLIKDIKANREKLNEVLNVDDTQKKLIDLFGKEAKKYGIEIEPKFDNNEFITQLGALAILAEKTGTKAGKTLADSINRELGNIQTKDVVTKTKDMLKEIDGEINRYKSKYDFYQKILDITGDEKFSISVAFEAEDQFGNDLVKFIRDKIQDISGEIELQIPEDLINKSFDDVFKGQDLLEIVGKDQLDVIRKYFEEIRKIQTRIFTDSIKHTKKHSLANLRAELKLLKDIKKAREKLNKVMSIDDTYKELKKLYGREARRFGIVIEPEFDNDKFVSKMRSIAFRAKKTGTEAGKNLANSINIAIGNIQMDDIVRDTKDIIDRIDGEVKRYRDKFDFYKSLFGVTKDEKLSFEVSFGIDKDGDKNLEKFIRDKIKQLSPDIAKAIPVDIISSSFDDVFKDADLKKLAGEDTIEAIKKYFNEIKKIQKANALENIKTLTSILNDFSSYEAQKLKIQEKYSKLRATLDSKYANLSIEEREEILKRMREGEAQEIAAVDASILAATQSYKDLYDNVEKFSIRKLKSIRDNWYKILDQVRDKQDTDGVFYIEVDGKSVKLTRETLEKITKKVNDLSYTIENNNPFEKIASGLKRLSKDGEGEATKGVEAISGGVKELAGMITPLSDALGELGEATDDSGMIEFAGAVGDAVWAMQSMADLAVGVAKAISGDPTELIKAVINITAQLIKFEADYQRAKRQHMIEAMKLQAQYNKMLLEEKLLFEEGISIFDINQFGGAINAAKVYRESLDQLDEKIGNISRGSGGKRIGFFAQILQNQADQLKGLETLYIKTGVERKKFLFITTGHRDVYKNLLSVYPDLITEEGKLNKVRAESVLQSGLLKDKSQELLQEMLDLQEVSEKAYEQLSQYLSGVFGQMGTEISDAIVDSFVNGEQAASKFSESVTGTMEQMVQDIARSIHLAPLFNDLQKEIEKIYKNPNLNPTARMNEIFGIMDKFYSDLGNRQQDMVNFLDVAQQAASKYGFEIFDKQQELGNLTQTIQGMTEDTARKLEAIMNSEREIALASDGKLQLISEGITIGNQMASQQLAYMQTLTQAFLAHARIFESLVKQGSEGAGLKTYIQ